MMLTNIYNRNTQLIGQRYELISTSSQTPYRQFIADDTSALKIEVSIESSFSGSSQVNQNAILLFECLILLNRLFAAAPEGLKEASETLKNITEYYSDNASNTQQTSLPQELGIIKGSVLPSEVRPPLVLDFD